MNVFFCIADSNCTQPAQFRVSVCGCTVRLFASVCIHVSTVLEHPASLCNDVQNAEIRFDHLNNRIPTRIQHELNRVFLMAQPCGTAA
eukprot:m.620485 g.620485  ORF g.620485 m.620485 type:complete len:88 (+) comp22536_c0_seq9:737-1000(+)